MRVTKVTTLAETPYLRLNLSRFRNKGKEGAWSWVSRQGGARAVAIAGYVFMDDDSTQMVLLREYRVPLKGYCYALPAGLIGPREGPVSAAKREFKEETGLSLSVIEEESRPLLLTSPGLTDESCHIVYGVAKEGKLSDRMQESSEDARPLLVSQERAFDMLWNDRGVKMDIKAYFVLRNFALTGGPPF